MSVICVDKYEEQISEYRRAGVTVRESAVWTGNAVWAVSKLQAKCVA